MAKTVDPLLSRRIAAAARARLIEKAADVDERLDILAAIVWPRDPRLVELPDRRATAVRDRAA